MYKITSLSIGLQYVDDDAGSWSLWDLCLNRGVINPEHLTFAGFQDAVGGLRLYDRRIFCFLDTDGLTDLFSTAWFLLESVTALRAVADDSADSDDSDDSADSDDTSSAMHSPNRVMASLHHEDGSQLRLSEAGGHCQLSFLNEHGECPKERHSPYFEGVTIAAPDWTNAAMEALGEYAMIARRVAGPHIDISEGPGRIIAAVAELV